MATLHSSLRGTSSSSSLGDLSSELIALVIEFLCAADPTSAATCRTLSKRFHGIATPIRYRSLILNERLLSPGAEARCPQLFRNIARWAHHVEARSDLDPAGICRILTSVERLQSVRWRYVGAEISHGSLWLPSDILKSQQRRFRGVKLYIEDLPLKEFEEKLRDTYVRAIPSELLVSLKLARPAPPLTTRLESLKQLLLSSENLETLHYEDRGQGTSFKFKRGECMPPFKDLSLRSYDWDHSREDVDEHWDFSELESLRLVYVPIFNFLDSIDPTDLANLHTLHCEDFSAHLPADSRQAATQGLYLLARRHIRALRDLSITCHIKFFNLDGILAHSNSLERLKFRDHVGFGEEDRRCPTLWPAELASMGCRLPHVHTLELDLDVAQCDPSEFLRAVCAFPALHTLTLHVQTVLHAFERVHPGTDRDRDSAMRTVSFLQHIRGQQQEQYRQLQNGRCFPSFREVTINVGGWRKVMVRRLSTAWRKQNDQGIFAERCFVFERMRPDDEGMAFREESCVETRSTTPRATPELR